MDYRTRNCRQFCRGHRSRRQQLHSDGHGETAGCDRFREWLCVRVELFRTNSNALLRRRRSRPARSRLRFSVEGSLEGISVAPSRTGPSPRVGARSVRIRAMPDTISTPEEVTKIRKALEHIAYALDAIAAHTVPAFKPMVQRELEAERVRQEAERIQRERMYREVEWEAEKHKKGKTP